MLALAVAGLLEPWLSRISGRCKVASHVGLQWARPPYPILDGDGDGDGGGDDDGDTFLPAGDTLLPAGDRTRSHVHACMHACMCMCICMHACRQAGMHASICRHACMHATAGAAISTNAATTGSPAAQATAFAPPLPSSSDGLSLALAIRGTLGKPQGTSRKYQ